MKLEQWRPGVEIKKVEPVVKREPLKELPIKQFTPQKSEPVLTVPSVSDFSLEKSDH